LKSPKNEKKNEYLIDDQIKKSKIDIANLKEKFYKELEKPHNKILQHIIMPFKEYEREIYRYIDLLKRKAGEN
jgi:hypothetical protein